MNPYSFEFCEIDDLGIPFEKLEIFFDKIKGHASLDMYIIN